MYNSVPSYQANEDNGFQKMVSFGLDQDGIVLKVPNPFPSVIQDQKLSKLALQKTCARLENCTIENMHTKGSFVAYNCIFNKVVAKGNVAFFECKVGDLETGGSLLAIKCSLSQAIDVLDETLIYQNVSPPLIWKEQEPELTQGLL